MPRPGVPLLFAFASIAAIVGNSEGRANLDLVLRAVTVIDPGGSSSPAPFDVLIGGGRILGMEPPAGTATASQVVDAAGLFLIPGLIDTHVHLTVPSYPQLMERRLSDAFLDGVTSVREMGGDLKGIESAIVGGRDPRRPTPRIYPSALLAGTEWIAHEHFPPGFRAGMVPWLRAVLPNADPDAIVEEALRAGVTGVKMTSGLDTGMVHRLSDRAHAAGLMVWTHAAVHPGRPRDAVMAGADVISHSPLLAWEIPKVNWPGEIDAASWLTACGEVVRTPAPIDALFTMMRERGTLLEPTLLTYHRGAEARRDTGRLEACSKWLAARAHAAGIPLVAGTDTFVSLGGRAMLHDEMRRLVLDAGLTPREALAAATCNAARALGRAGHVGRIAIGMEADLVLLAADPTVDIDNTRRVVAVIKQGRLFLVRPGTEPAPH